ncbi:unnamed protein product [Linum tenue]|uniref:Uncharacterized protein n=1 Tax=Linum tenue TaxID=586396 RepID=A0AAV0MTP2_9ROSI|nr:unnamed protein product [Linum tenue]
MKRAIPWSDDDGDKDSSDSDDGSSTSSSASDAEGDVGTTKTKTKNASKHKNSKGKSARRRRGAVEFEELRRHGYKGGPSLLRMPPPKDDTEPNWTWSTGKERLAATKVENGESYDERQKTRAALVAGEQLVHSQTRKEKEEKNQLSFSQKEKRKRELGQASRGKNYVEEEKRLLRESGVYSGFDT